jgi:hypothetical protein
MECLALSLLFLVVASFLGAWLVHRKSRDPPRRDSYEAARSESLRP